MPDVLTTALPKLLMWLRGPIAIVSGSLGTWLTTHIHLFATFHVDQDSVAGTITQAIIFGITALAANHGISQWVKGHQIELAKAWDLWNQSGKTQPPTGSGVKSIR